MRKILLIVLFFCTLCLPLNAWAKEDFSVWGNLGFGIYPVTVDRVAPNEVSYSPLFHLRTDLFLGTLSRYFFIFTKFLAERPNPGVTTNKNQGVFDFTKREFDITVGMAFNFSRNWYWSIWTYGYNNLNRGNDLKRPFGFKDGFAMDLRYHREISNINLGLTLGYYFTKELVASSKEAYEPNLFLDMEISKTLTGIKIGIYGRVITEKTTNSVKESLAGIYLAKNITQRLTVQIVSEEDWDIETGEGLSNFYLELLIPFGSR